MPPWQPEEACRGGAHAFGRGGLRRAKRALSTCGLGERRLGLVGGECAVHVAREAVPAQLHLLLMGAKARGAARVGRCQGWVGWVGLWVELGRARFGRGGQGRVGLGRARTVTASAEGDQGRPG